MKKIEFIYNSINDAREIIKMIDIKANFLVFFIIMIISGLLRFNNSQNILRIILILFGLFIILYLFYNVFIARFNPEKNIKNINLEDKYRKLFFPTKIYDYKELCNTFKNTNEDILQEILLYERLKLQFIIEKKIKHFNIVIKIFFPIFLILVGVSVL